MESCVAEFRELITKVILEFEHLVKLNHALTAENVLLLGQANGRASKPHLESLRAGGNGSSHTDIILRETSSQSLPSVKSQGVEARRVSERSVTSPGAERCNNWSLLVKASSMGTGCEFEATTEPITPLTRHALESGTSYFGEDESRNDVKFKLQKTWQKYDLEATAPLPWERVFSPDQARINAAAAIANAPKEDTLSHRLQGGVSKLISYPGAPWRIVWDLIGGLFILFDMIAIPLRAFDLGDDVGLKVANWLTLIFWTANMAMSPFVGFVKEGITIMDPHRILMNYLKSWFIIDVFVLMPDWYFTIAEIYGAGSSDTGSSMRMIRIIRLMRFARLLRLAKLRQILNGINDLINSEYVSLIVNMNVLIMTLLISNHFVACGWFAISDLSQGPLTWIEEYGYNGAAVSHQYLASYHWSLAQFTPSTMDISPKNNVERFFAVCVVVVALVGFSYLVGSITGCLTQLRLMQEDMYKQFWHLRRYMKHHKVPMALSARIQRYLEHAMQEKKSRTATEKVKILSHLSEQLHSELQCVMSERHLKVHPLFDHLSVVSMVSMHRISTTAISRQQFARGDTIFIANEKATQLEFVVAGRLNYLREDSEGIKHEEWVDKDEDWISEPAFWLTSWYHLGVLLSATESDLLRVDADQFAGAIRLNPYAYQVVATYAKRFVHWLNGEDPDSLTDIAQGDDPNAAERIQGFLVLDPAWSLVDDSQHGVAERRTC